MRNMSKSSVLLSVHLPFRSQPGLLVGDTLSHIETYNQDSQHTGTCMLHVHQAAAMCLAGQELPLSNLNRPAP